MPERDQVVFVIDAGLLLEPVNGPTFAPYLLRQSPLPESEAGEIVRPLLIAEEDTEQVRADVAARLEIGVDALEGYHSPDVRWAAGAVGALAHMHQMSYRVVVVGDVAARDAEHVAVLRQATTRLGFEVYPSYETGLVLSDAGLCHLIARRHHVEPKNMVVLSDAAAEVTRAAEFGVRGIWFSHDPLPKRTDARAPVRVAPGWPEAVPIVEDIAATGSRTPSTPPANPPRRT